MRVVLFDHDGKSKIAHAPSDTDEAIASVVAKLPAGSTNVQTVQSTDPAAVALMNPPAQSEDDRITERLQKDLDLMAIIKTIATLTGKTEAEATAAYRANRRS